MGTGYSLSLRWNSGRFDNCGVILIILVILVVLVYLVMLVVCLILVE